MPTICVFYGITVRMYYDDHNQSMSGQDCTAQCLNHCVTLRFSSRLPLISLAPFAGPIMPTCLPTRCTQTYADSIPDQAQQILPVAIFRQWRGQRPQLLVINVPIGIGNLFRAGDL